MKKYIFILAAILMVAMAGFNACGKKNDPDDNPDNPGDGSTGNPFKVAVVADLKRVGTGEEGPGGLKWERNKHYKQVADINLNGVNWNPICGDTPDIGWFTGSYDGGGYTVSNLTITEGNQHIGLFGNVDGIIKNVWLNCVRISGKEDVGSVVGFLRTGGTIEHCSVNDIEISANRIVGGLVGSVYNNATVNACMVTKGTVTGNSGFTYYLTGGIAGENTNGTIKNCYATVNVTGHQQVGGIVGYNEGNATVQYCYATGNVTSSIIEVGGIAGKNSGKILNCVALNAQIARQTANHLDVNNLPVIGRIIGSNSNSPVYPGTMNNNYARSDMTLTTNAVTFPLGEQEKLNGVHGENVTETNYTGDNSGTWWSGTAGFPGAEWTFQANMLPRLKGFD